MRQPMPSPNGTNRENLFMPRRGPVAAYDAAPGGQMECLKLLAAKLSAEDWAALQGVLTDGPDVNGDDDLDLTGNGSNGPAMDARVRMLISKHRRNAAASFDALFPGAARPQVA